MGVQFVFKQFYFVIRKQTAYSHSLRNGNATVIALQDLLRYCLEYGMSILITTTPAIIAITDFMHLNEVISLQ